MANYGTAFASFYNADLQLLYDNSGSLSTSTGISYIEVLNARGNSSFMGVGYGEFYVPPGDIANSPLVAVGHYAIVYQQDQIGSYQGEIACFIIKDIHVEVLDAVPMLKISGPEVTQELAQYLKWQDVGDQASDYASIDATGSYPKNTNKIDISTAEISKFAVNNSVNLYNTAGLFSEHRARVTAVDTTTSSENITIDPPLYETIDDVTDITIFITDYQTPATDDITQIMSGPVADGTWDLTVQGGGDGTTNGTSHVCDGVTILDLLNAAAEISGEWWRLKQRTAGNVAPLREIEWRSTSDSTGITLVMPTQAQMISRVTSTSYGIIESVKRQYRDERISHLIAYGGGSGDKRVSLVNATDTAPTGYTLTTNTTGRHTVLSNDALETLFDPGKREIIVTFPDIQPGGVTDADLEQAGNQLLAAAHNWMEARNEKLRFYEVECVIHKNVRPGQTIGLTYSDQWLTLTQATLYIVEYEHYVGDDNVRRTRLTLSEALQQRTTGNDLLASALRSNRLTASTLGAGAARTTNPAKAELVVACTPLDGESAESIDLVPMPQYGFGTSRFGHLSGASQANANYIQLWGNDGGEDKTTFVYLRSYADTVASASISAQVVMEAQGSTGSHRSYIQIGTINGVNTVTIDADGGTLVSDALKVGNGSSGSVIIDQTTADSEALLLQSDDVTHGMTSITSDTNTYFSAAKYSANNGGVVMRGFTEGNAAVAIYGYVTTNVTGTGTGAAGPVLIRGFLKSGTSTTALASDDNLVVFSNAGTSVAFVRGDGSIYSAGDVRATDGMAVGSITRNPGAGEIYFEIQGSAASAPGSGALALYAYNGQLWVKNSAGTAEQLTSF